MLHLLETLIFILDFIIQGPSKRLIGIEVLRKEGRGARLASGKRSLDFDKDVVLIMRIGLVTSLT